MTTAKLTTHLLRVFAFLAPIYFIFYPPLHDRPLSPEARRLWRITAAGFGFYAAAIAILPRVH